jgi:hypothetical protein
MPAPRHSRKLPYILPIVALLLGGLHAGFAPAPEAAAQGRPQPTAHSPAVPQSSAAPAGGLRTLAGLSTAVDEVAREVEALRGWKFLEPVIRRLATPEQVRQYIERQIETTLPPGKLARSQAFLRTVGLVPRDRDLRTTFLDLLESQVGGFYDPDTRALYLVERAGMPPAMERVLLAHELTHALDDQHASMGAFLKAHSGVTEDMDVVTMSVLEGSATALMIQYLARAQLSGRIDMAAVQAYAAEEMERSKMLLSTPAYFSAMVASYICGTRFLARGDLMALLMAEDNRATGENLLVVSKDPPRSSEQILHPEKYWDPALRDEPVLVEDAPVEKWLSRQGRWVVHVDTLGELLTALLTSPRGRPLNLLAMQVAESWTNSAAMGWGGDRFFLTASGPTASEAARTLESTEGVWVTLWDTPADRDEFVSALAGGAVAEGYSVALLGAAGAVVFFDSEESERARLTADIDAAGLRFTKGGKAWSPHREEAAPAGR